MVRDANLSPSLARTQDTNQTVASTLYASGVPMPPPQCSSPPKHRSIPQFKPDIASQNRTHTYP